ncbi:hypothetical protein GUITHDRAFT_49725, partial [Guillardia theta CCMP2712]
TEFGRLMQQAVAMKTEMMKSDRRKYDRLPSFLQSSIYHMEKLKDTRSLPFQGRLEAAESMKEEGNLLFKEEKFDMANIKYEESLSVFKYLEVLEGHEDWKTNGKGLRDEIYRIVDEDGVSSGQEEMIEAISRHKQSCYLNIAACAMKQNNWQNCVRACDAALELDPQSVKAFYRRALARITPASSGAHEQDLALQDLEQAYEIDPTNVKVKAKLLELRKQIAKQKHNDKATFSGMFDRGTIQSTATAASSSSSNGTGRSSSGQSQVVNEDTFSLLEKQLEDAERIALGYKNAGKHDKAEAMFKSIEESRQRIEAAKERAQGNFTPLEDADFDNPTEEMINDAKKHGIDLTDPVVRRFCKQLQKEKLEKGSIS